MKKVLFVLAMIFGLAIGFVSCSSSDDDEYPKTEQVSIESLNNTIWYSDGVSGIIGFKDGKVAYRTYNSLGGFQPKHVGTYSVKNGILSINLDGETEVMTVKVSFYTKSKYSERHLLLSMNEQIYEEFPFGECSVNGNDEWKYLFDE